MLKYLPECLNIAYKFATFTLQASYPGLRTIEEGNVMLLKQREKAKVDC